MTPGPAILQRVTFDSGTLDDFTITSDGTGSASLVAGRIRTYALKQSTQAGNVRMLMPLNPSPLAKSVRYYGLSFWTKVVSGSSSEVTALYVSTDAFGARIAPLKFGTHAWSVWPHTDFGGTFGQIPVEVWVRINLEWDCLTGVVVGEAYDTAGGLIVQKELRIDVLPNYTGPSYLRINSSVGTFGAATYYVEDIVFSGYGSRPGSPEHHKLRRRRAAWMNLERPAFF